MTKVLVVEDEVEIVRLLELELSHEGYEVETAFEGKTGLEKIEKGNYDIVLLDVMLPVLNGIEVCRKTRKFSNVPIIMLTARDHVIDKVTGLDTGADDYLTKPFSIYELLARIRSALRRTLVQQMDSTKLNFKNIVINPDTHEVQVDNRAIDLTKTEYNLLEYLVRNKNHVLTREQILDAVWGYDYFGDTNVVDVYIRYLRIKLDDGCNEKYITTVRGTGYIMRDAMEGM